MRWTLEASFSSVSRPTTRSMEHPRASAIRQAEREEKADDAEVAQIRRERDRMRQRNSRLCRKFGLKSRRARKGER